MTILIQIATNDFFSSREVFNSFLTETESKIFRKQIKDTLGLYHSSSSGNLMGDYSIYGRNHYTIIETDIGNSDIPTETSEEANIRLINLMN